VAGLVAVAGLFCGLALAVAGIMLVLSLLVAALQAAQARLPSEHDGLTSRLLVAALCYAQPLVRSWKRHGTRLLRYRPPRWNGVPQTGGPRMPLTGTAAVAYWSEDGCERTQLLQRVLAYLDEYRWGKVIDSGWVRWDLLVYCHLWTGVEVSTAQEEHGGGKRLLRVRYRLRVGGYVKALRWTAVVALPAAVALQAWGVAVAATGLLALGAGLWWLGSRRASQVMAVFDAAALAMGLICCEPERRRSPHGERVQEADHA
jgi:hypothetical protein